MLCVYSVFVAIYNTRNSLTTKRHAPPRLGAPLRYGPRHYIPPLRGSHLFFWGGSRGLGLRVFAFYALTGRPLRGSTAGYYMAPLRGSELGSLTLAKLPPSHPSNFRFIKHGGLIGKTPKQWPSLRDGNDGRKQRELCPAQRRRRRAANATTPSRLSVVVVGSGTSKLQFHASLTEGSMVVIPFTTKPFKPRSEFGR